MAKCTRCGRNMSGFGFGKKVCSWCVQHEAQQRGELRDDEVQQVMPTPWSQTGVGTGPNLVTQLLLAVNVMVFGAMVMAGMSITDPAGKDLIRWGANWSPLTLSDEWWRFVSYMFLHGGIIHLGLNMWCLWNLGALAEALYGHETFLIVYLLSGVGGGVASTWWHPMGLSVGASGAIFGIEGALIASLTLGEFSLPRDMISGYSRTILMFSAYGLIFGWVSSRVDNACHIGGLVTGLILGALIAKVAPGRDQLFSRLGVLLIGGLLVAGSGYWLRHSYGFVIHSQRGGALLGQGKLDAAIPELEQAVRMKPTDTASRIELGYAYQLKSEFAKSEVEFKRALEQNPKEEMALYGLGSLYFAQNKNSEARNAFARLLTINPKSADAHYGLGEVAALGEGDCDTALREYKVAAELSGEPIGALEMAQCYNKLKRYDETIAALQTFARDNADSPELEAALAEAYRGKGMTKEADAATKRADELRQNQH